MPEEQASPEIIDNADWDGVYDRWRRGLRFWLQMYGGGPSGGYIIDYSTRPRKVFRWRRHSAFGEEPTIIQLPPSVHLIFRNVIANAPADAVQ